MTSCDCARRTRLEETNASKSSKLMSGEGEVSTRVSVVVWNNGYPLEGYNGYPLEG